MKYRTSRVAHLFIRTYVLRQLSRVKYQTLSYVRRDNGPVGKPEKKRKDSFFKSGNYSNKRKYHVRASLIIHIFPLISIIHTEFRTRSRSRFDI